jgi:hypothetical protein
MELCELYVDELRWEEAQQWLEKAKGFPSGYDFEKHLEMRVKKYAPKIQKRGKEDPAK